MRLCLATLLCALPFATPVNAQLAMPVVKKSGSLVNAEGSVLVDNTGAAIGTPANPLVSAPSGSATSTAQTGTITATAATATSGAATFSAGTGKAGPLTPTRGYAIRLQLKGTWSGTAYLGTSTDGCATVSPLTAGGSPITYTAPLNEIVDAPASTGSDAYCLVATLTSGTLTYSVRQ